MDCATGLWIIAIDADSRALAMHAAEFHEAFNGLTQIRAARWFGVGPRSVRRWRSGDRRTPVGVTIIFRLLAAGTVTVEQVEAAAFPVSARTNSGAEPEPSAPVEPEPEQSALARAFAGLSPAAAAVVALGPKSCRWPIGDPRARNFCFCGASVVAGFYCEEHDAMAHMPLPTRGGHDVVRQLVVA
jgi:hypothetical protein